MNYLVKGVAELAKNLSPYKNGPYRGEDYAYQTVYNRLINNYAGGRRHRKKRGGGWGSAGKAGFDLLKGFNNLFTAKLKEPNKALWGKGRKRRRTRASGRRKN